MIDKMKGIEPHTDTLIESGTTNDPYLNHYDGNIQMVSFVNKSDFAFEEDSGKYLYNAPVFLNNCPDIDQYCKSQEY
jgi:hypothetical protein